MKSSFITLGALAALLLFGGWYLASRSSPQAQDTSSTMNEHTTSMPMTLSSSAFVPDSSIPAKYTCDGQRELNPPLTIAGAPEGAASLALIVDDPDVPKALKLDGVFDHWVLFNMPPDTVEIPEGGSVGTVGQNSAGAAAYTGPCPPTQYEPSVHRYVFALYALDITLPLSEGATKAQVLDAMQGHIIAQTRLVGMYHKL